MILNYIISIKNQHIDYYVETTKGKKHVVGSFSSSFQAFLVAGT